MPFLSTRGSVMHGILCAAIMLNSASCVRSATFLSAFLSRPPRTTRFAIASASTAVGEWRRSRCFKETALFGTNSSSIAEQVDAPRTIVAEAPEVSPWSPDAPRGKPHNVQSTKPKNYARFRQHVNPLARKFQMKTELPSGWPMGAFDDPTLPLHLDIGCGKGGFLLDLAAARGKEPEDAEYSAGGFTRMNYLGLEIRPSVARYAQDRVEKWGLTGTLCFVGCNANVDLERILSFYEEAGGHLGCVSIQFPDPHFKASHAKRRVVTPVLVETLARFVRMGDAVFLQSDVKSVLDDMRERFRESDVYFTDEVENVEEYLEVNPLGIPTEREVSVIKQGLPVYRTVIRRTGNKHKVTE